MDRLKNKITKFALLKIESELTKSLELEKDGIDADNCNCYWKSVFRLPCKHQLLKAENIIPLDIVHPRWHILFHDGRGKAKSFINYKKKIFVFYLLLLLI